MPATRCQAMFTLAAACGLLLLSRAVPATGEDSTTELEETLNGDDEVHLLQERVLERRRGSGGAAGAGAPAEQKAGTPGICEDPPAEALDAGLGLADALRPVPEVPADATEAGPPSLVGAPRRTDLEGISSDTVEACTWALRRALSALTALALLAGVGRWRARGCSAAGPEEEETPGRAGADLKELMRAALAGDEARARRLLGGGAPVGEADLWGCTALHAAAKGGLRGLAAELLDRGADLGAADAWDDTPLHTACRAGWAEVCELLVARGAEVDAVNVEGWAPLVVAGHAGHRDVCLLLLGRGAGAPGLPEEELPPLLRELSEKGTPMTVAPEEELLPEWPTEEDWEEHMRESVDGWPGLPCTALEREQHLRESADGRAAL